MQDDIELTNAIQRIKDSAEIIYNIINADEDFSVDVNNGTLLSLLALQKRVTDQTDIVNQTLEDTIASLSFRSEWTTSTAYNAEDFVRVGDIMYMALSAHTSHVTDFNTDLTAGKWIIYAPTNASFMKYEGISLPDIFKRSFYIATTVASAKLINTTNFKYLFIRETGGFYEWIFDSEASADNSTVITPTANVGGAGRFILLSILSTHTKLTGRSSANSHPSEAISHSGSTVKAILDDYNNHKSDQTTAHGMTSESTATKPVKRDSNGYTKIKAPDYTDVNVDETYAVNVKVARNIKSVIDTHANKTSATAANPIHGSSALVVANRLVHRDPDGRAEVSNPDLNKPKQIVNVETFKATKDAVDAHIDTDSTDNPHGATPDLTSEAMVRRDSSGTCKFGIPTEDEHPMRKVDIETLPQLLGIARFDGDGDALTYRGDYTFGASYNLNDTVRDPDTGDFYVCIDSFNTNTDFREFIDLSLIGNEETTFPFMRHIGDVELDTTNSLNITVAAETVGSTFDLQETYAGSVWANKYHDSRHTYLASEGVRVVINEGQTPANGYLGEEIELDITSQLGVLFQINAGAGLDGEGEFEVLGDIRAYYESELAISPVSSPIHHMNIYTGVKIIVSDFEIDTPDDITVTVSLRDGGGSVVLSNTMYTIDNLDNSINILPDQINNAILTNFLSGTNVAQGTYSVQREVDDVTVRQRSFKTGTIADTFWSSIADPTGLLLKAQNNISVNRLTKGIFVATIGSDTSLSNFMLNVFLPTQSTSKGNDKEEYNAVLDYGYGDDNQVRIYVYENGNLKDLNNIQITAYK